jgi:hypothetical protein
MISATTANRPTRVFDPERLDLLITVYDECLQRLVTWYSVTEPSELHGMNVTVAKRVIAAAESGIIDPKEMREVALVGLLPDSLSRVTVRPGPHAIPAGRQ